jgi:hypothetical protein
MGNVTNILISLVTISFLCVSFSYVLGVSTIGTSVIYAIFEKESINSQNPSFNTTLDSHVSKTVSQSEAGETLYFIGVVDGLKKGFAFIVDLFTMGFAVFHLLNQLGAPIFLSSVIGLPVAIGYYISLVSAIRGYDI